MTRDLVLDLIDHYELSEYRELLEPLVQPSVRIRTAALSADASHLKSKFGDRPLLPPGVPWPTWDASGYHASQLQYWKKRAVNSPDQKTKWLEGVIARTEAAIKAPPCPLAFIGQISLDELPQPDLVGLPGNGRLLFFYNVVDSAGSYDPAARRSARVLYVPDGAGVIAEPPADLNSSALFRAATMSFEMEWTLPEDPSIEGVPINPFEKGDDRYAKLLADVYGDERTMHRIGGNAQPIQNDMRLEAQLVTNGIWCGDASGYQDPRRAALEAGAADWTLLLQVDSDEDGPGWMWGDIGRLYFWIRRQDLARLDFDQIWCSEQCY